MAVKLVQFRDPGLAIPHDEVADITRVGFYPREFYPLDNFSAFQVDWRGDRFATAEHAYQWAKFADVDSKIADQVAATRSPHEAQKLARLHESKQAADWPQIKVAIMTEILRHKLDQNAYVRKKLLQTLALEIVEDSPKDSFWGWGPDRNGQNQLGKIWMLLRSEL